MITSKIFSQQGSMAVDFLFAFTLIFGFMTLLFSVALTLTAVEMTQYMTFAAARKLHAAHIDEAQQSESAQRKYQKILQSDAYQILRGGWFEVYSDPFVGDATELSELSGYNQGDEPNLFNGVVTQFTARVLSFGLGSFGETTPDDDPGDGSSFATHIGSYLGREPTSEECMQFNADRWNAIRQLRSRAGGVGYAQGTDENAYVPISDNGC